LFVGMGEEVHGGNYNANGFVAGFRLAVYFFLNCIMYQRGMNNGTVSLSSFSIS
jgi:hypothetical protein